MSTFYNPPADVPGKGRMLRPGTYQELRRQLGKDEVLIQCYRHRNEGFAILDPQSGEREDFDGAWEYEVAKLVESCDDMRSQGDVFAVPRAAVAGGLGL